MGCEALLFDFDPKPIFRRHKREYVIIWKTLDYKIVYLSDNFHRPARSAMYSALHHRIQGEVGCHKAREAHKVFLVIFDRRVVTQQKSPGQNLPVSIYVYAMISQIRTRV